MSDILVIDRERLLALLTVWETDEVTEGAEAEERGQELIRRMEAEAAVKTFVVDYHHRHGNDISVVAADTMPNNAPIISALGLDFEPKLDEYLDVWRTKVISAEPVKRCTESGEVILTTGHCTQCPASTKSCPVAVPKP